MANDAQIGALTGQLEELRAQFADLAAQVRQNSADSSRPPSSDAPGKPAPKSLRKKTGRQCAATMRPGRLPCSGTGRCGRSGTKGQGWSSTR